MTALDDTRAVPNEPGEPAPPHAGPPVVTRMRGGRAERPRVPPHNLEAEESLLGAMLLSRDAVAAALAGVSADDFYKPSHAHVFAAVCSLHAAGEPTDPVSVADALDRRGLLAEAGGVAALITLQTHTPSTSSAPRYARIVREHAAMRRLAGAAAEISELAHSSPEDVPAALAAAAEEVERAGAGVAGGPGRRPAFEDVGAVLRGEVEALRPTMLRRTDGVALLYPGLLHWLMGEHGKGKTWAALYAAAEVMADGGAVVYLDWEGNRRVVGSRLGALGMTAEVLDDRLLYLRPPVLTPALVSSVVAAATERGAELVVCDGVAKALARQGLNEDKAPDVLAWLELLAAPLTEADMAVLCLDHVVKDKEGRGMWARGSGAKLGEVSGAAWMVVPRRVFSRKHAGSFDLVQAKDREGFNAADGEAVATVTVTPRDEGDRVSVVVGPPPSTATAPDGTPRRTGYMERASRALEGPLAAGMGAGVTQRWVEEQVQGKSQYVREALRALASEGFVDVEHTGRTMHYRLAKPFREDGEQPPDEAPPEPEELF